MRCESMSVVANAPLRAPDFAEVAPAWAEFAGMWVAGPDCWTAISHIYDGMLSHANSAP